MVRGQNGGTQNQGCRWKADGKRIEPYRPISTFHRLDLRTSSGMPRNLLTCRVRSMKREEAQPMAFSVENEFSESPCIGEPAQDWWQGLE